ncbi:hypothetical protein ACJX0J_031020, partial [Zea mays]
YVRDGCNHGAFWILVFLIVRMGAGQGMNSVWGRNIYANYGYKFKVLKKIRNICVC